MSGPNDRRKLSRLKNPVVSEAEFLAEQERRNEELFQQLEAECARSLEEYEAQAASNGQTNGHANGHKNGHEHGRRGEAMRRSKR
jgi:flagellar biosynthesis/type III secretory pathway protein FliH